MNCLWKKHKLVEFVAKLRRSMSWFRRAGWSPKLFARSS